MTLTFHHPKYYAALRAERKKLQASSFKHGGRRKRPTVIDQIHDAWARDNGYKASSSKRQASSPKQEASSSKPEVTSSMIREPRNI